MKIKVIFKMDRLHNCSQVLNYFFKLVTHSSPEVRFYSEKFLINAKKLRGIIFLFFKILSKSNECEGQYLFSVIFLKNLFNSELNKNSKKEIYLEIFCLIEMSVCCSAKLICVLSEIVFCTFGISLQNSLVFSSLIDNINQKLSKKILLKNKNESFYSILVVLEKITKLCLIIKKSNDLSKNYLNILEKTLKIIFIFVGKVSNLNLGKLQLSILILLTNLFKIINTYNLVTKLGQDLDSWVLIFLSIIDNIKNKDNFFDMKLELKDNILVCISKLSTLYQNEFSIYLPIFCDLALKFSDSNMNKKLSSTIEFIGSVTISTNSLIITENNKFKENLKLIFLQIISNHIIYKQKIYQFPIFVFLSKNFNFFKRLTYGNILVNSIYIKKRKIVFNCPSLFSQNTVLYPFFIYILPVVFSVIYSVINGTFVKGVFVTYCLSNIKILFSKFYTNLKDIQEKKKCLFFIDFVSFFRYQLPLKLLSKAIQLLFDVITESGIFYSHFLSFIERVLNTRGNDKDGILMFYHRNILKEQLLFCLLQKSNLNLTTFMTKINIKKIFMRILLNNFKNSEKYSRNLVKYVLSDLIITNNKSSTFFSVFDFEILNLKICLDKCVDKEFLSDFVRFGVYILSENQTEIIPYVLDIFVSLIETEKYEIIFPVFLRIFKGLLNPHIWLSNSLVKSSLEYLKIFISNKKYLYDKNEIISLCCITQTIIEDHGDKEYFFFFLLSLLNVIKFQIKFFPHFLEIFILKQNFLKNKQSKDYLYIFMILLIDEVGLYKIIELCNRIQENFFVSLNKNILFTFFQVFVEKLITNDIRFLKKIIGKICRQIILFSKIFENDINITKKINFENNFRFKNTYSVNKYNIIYTYEPFFILDELIERISFF
nr:exportin-2 [Cryptomonas curvata]